LAFAEHGKLLPALVSGRSLSVSAVVTAALRFDLSQARVANAEVMSDLVDDHLSDALHDLFLGAAEPLDGSLIDEYAVRQGHVVAAASPGLWDAPVESEQGVSGGNPACAQLFGGGGVPHLDVDVREPLGDSSRQVLHGALNEFFKTLSIHEVTLTWPAIDGRSLCPIIATQSTSAQGEEKERFCRGLGTACGGRPVVPCEGLRGSAPGECIVDT
jgi:hypothetical protein